MIKKSRLRWFGHVERKDDNDWVKHGKLKELLDREDARKRPGGIVLSMKNDMESLGLSQKDAQSRNKWRRRIKGATG